MPSHRRTRSARGDGDVRAERPEDPDERGCCACGADSDPRQARLPLDPLRAPWSDGAAHRSGERCRFHHCHHHHRPCDDGADACDGGSGRSWLHWAVPTIRASMLPRPRRGGRGPGRSARRAVLDPVAVALLGEEELALHGELLLLTVRGDHRIEDGHSSVGLGP